MKLSLIEKAGLTFVACLGLCALSAPAQARPVFPDKRPSVQIAPTSMMLAVNEESTGGAKGEGKCGEGKCGGGKEAKPQVSPAHKSGDGKCGEGKCGGGKEEKPAETKHEASGEGKCGEGKCGGGK